MKITLTIDALSPTLSGIGRYCWELVQRIPALAHPDEVFFYRDAAIWKRPDVFISAGPKRKVPGFLKKFQAKTQRQKVAAAFRDTLIHSPNYFLPPQAEGGIITVHDLSVFKFPETHPVERLNHFEREFSLSIARARLIITDTETVRREVCQFTGFPEERVVAVPLGVDARYRPQETSALQATLVHWGLVAQGYALCVGALEPRKRIGEVIKVWRRLPDLLRLQFPLVIAGPKGWLNDEIEVDLARGQAEGWVRRLGFVPENLLPMLYAGARLFAYPSVYEGFGLPLIEAMASGIPVVATRSSCIPEVCGGAAALIEDGDEDALYAAVVNGLTNPDWRAEAHLKGLARSLDFTWDACAEKTYGAYQQAMMF